MVQSQGERRRYVTPLPSATRRPRAHHRYFSEKSLAALKLARRNKVEDFKKRTNYYETRELLERYEDGPSTGVPPARPIDDMSSRRQSQLLATPQRAAPATAPNTPTNLRNPPISPGLQSQLTRMYPKMASCSYSCISHALCRDPTTPSFAPAQALVRQACRCASRRRWAIRERRSVTLCPYLPKVFRPQRPRERRHVGRHTYA
jgi:DNA-binding transcriptional MerR regulator